MKKNSFLYKFLVILLCFCFIQIPQVYAETTDVSYVAGRFAWDVAEMLKNKQSEINVPAAVYKNDLLGQCLKAATDVYPEGDALIKSIKYSGMTKTLSVEYIDNNARVFLANQKDDLILIRSIANKMNLSKYLVAFPNKIAIESFSEIEAVDPLIEFNADEVVINLFDKSKSTISGYNWKYPYVFYFSITKGETEEDVALTNSYVYKNILGIHNNLSVKEKVKQVNAILTSSFEYETNYQNNPQSHLPSYMVKNKKGVCSAYAILAYRMLNSLNVPVRLVTGNALSDMETLHVWLAVRDENGEWYHFDPTWNDPVPDVKGRVLTDYLYKTDLEMSTSHSWDTNKYNKTNNDIAYNQLVAINNPNFLLGIKDGNFRINNIQARVDLNPTVTPILINDSTYLPLRVLVESLGGSISWDEITQTVSIIINNKKIDVQINSLFANVDGYSTQLIAPPVIQDGRTLLPLRSVMELLGKTVTWNDADQTILIQ